MIEDEEGLFDEELEHQSGNPNIEPDWTENCSTCGSTPVVPQTGMCGPCTWGEAETVDGNW